MGQIIIFLPLNGWHQALCTFALVGWYKEPFLCFDWLNLGQSEIGSPASTALGGGVSKNRLIKALTLMYDLIAQLFPAVLGVRFLGDLGGGLGGVLGFGIGPGKPQGQGERRNALTEELPCSPHNAVQIVFFHIAAS